MRFKDESQIPQGGSENFVKLKDKESITGVFLGDPFDFYCVWKDKKVDVVPEGSAGAKFRFRINFIVKDKAGYIAKIFEQGPGIYKRLIKLNSDFQGLDGVVVKISRLGSTMNDTEYFIDPVMDPKNPRQLAPVPKEALAVKLLDLGHEEERQEKAQGNGDPGFGPEPGYSPEPELPF